jgi:hypothetical protein
MGLAWVGALVLSPRSPRLTSLWRDYDREYLAISNSLSCISSVNIIQDRDLWRPVGVIHIYNGITASDMIRRAITALYGDVDG